ncbi:MAG: Omp28 family outer membrane lipoprotein [Bacteroidales bacterium]
MKILRYITLIISPLFFLACDNLDEKEYVIKIIETETETTPITKTQNTQSILLEDYTGWKCVNCPAAATLLNQLQLKYKQKLVVMSVHAGPFAKPQKTNNFLDLRTKYGEKWNEEFGLNNYPIGVINRLDNGTNSSKAIKKEEWDSRIENLLTSTQHLININLGAKLQGDKFLVSTQCIALKDIDFKTYISVLVLEDSIIGKQLDNDPTRPEIENYTFNHVLRSNGVIDYPLSDSILQNQTIQKNYKIDIDSTWNVKHCKIVVFITKANNGEVIQVNEIHIE